MARDLVQRAATLGVDTEYVDAHGRRRTVPDESLARLLEVLKPRPSAEPSIERQADGSPDALGVRRADSAVTIVAPKTAYQMSGFAQEKVWALAVQLYGVRSGRNWGHGDFTDLKDLVATGAAAGAAGIGLNPLHALFDDRPEQASPYSPNSRLFLNTFYIDVEAVPEFPGVSDELAAEIATARNAELIDYAAVAAAKTRAFKMCFEAFRRSRSKKRREAFEKFRAARGESLAAFSAFEVLRRKHGGVWWEWPEQDRRPSRETLERVHREWPDQVRYIEYLQWLADEQLAGCQAEAQKLGMPIGLYIDLAVGVEPGGADAWAEQDSIVQQVEVGAPPDLLNTAGQAWGLAAFDPSALVEQKFEPFRLLLEAAMRHAGAIRLDHVLGLNRLYLIPFGMKPSDGAYVRYPLEALLAVVAIESVRRTCLVIGEDLGTVPENLSARLADWGIWSYLVLLFERREGGVFKQPDEYRRNALVTFSTHDLPTFTGWQSGHDLRVKRGLGLDPGETDEERGRAHWLLGEALADANVSSDKEPDFLDALRFIARSPSRLLVVQIEDVLSVADQPNVPGTMTEHPNWRQKLPLDLDEIVNDPRLRAVGRVLEEEGRALPRPPSTKRKTTRR